MPDPSQSGATSLATALHAEGPDPARAADLMLFGRFIGSWDIAWGLDDSRAERRGELHFGWVLGGRAVQDVWLLQSADGAPGFHGSTLRFYDPEIAAWRSTWIEPVNGRVRRFIGRPEGQDIVLLSEDDEPRLRWRFTDVTDTSFRWVGEISHDGGPWVVDEKMRLTRR